jgi:pimeloyl-ACP methyl ester carboxylesterase
MRTSRTIAAVLVGVVFAAASNVLAADAGIAKGRTFKLPDGVEMAYVMGGRGAPALVFVHCGNCRKEIWRETLEAFAGRHKVVAMDLAGHGRSGAGRERWSLGALGADVAALVEHLKLPKVVLVGNSLGGPVSLEAARRLGPGRVLAVVAVDTLQNVEMVWPEEGWRRMLDAYHADFVKACRGLMFGLLPDDAAPAIHERIERETCGNDARAAIGLLETFRSYDQAAALREAGVPVWAINSTRFPTALETNRKYAPSFEVILMEGVGHYPQVERPAEFQADLRRVLQAVTPKR